MCLDFRELLPINNECMFHITFLTIHKFLNSKKHQLLEYQMREYEPAFFLSIIYNQENKT